MVAMGQRRALPLVALAASVAFVCPSRGDWLEDARRGWKKISNRPSPCEWIITVSDRYGGRTSTGRAMFKQYRRNSLAMDLAPETDDEGAAPAQDSQDEIQVFGRNDRYLFRLSRSAANGDWSVIGLMPYSDAIKSLEARPPVWILETLSHLDRFSRLPVSIEGTLLAELFASPAVTVESAEPVTSGNGQLYRVVFGSNVDPGHVFPTSYSLFSYSKGTIYLDTSHNWRLTKAVLETSRGDKRTIVWEYDPTKGFCSKITTTGGEGEGAYVMTKAFSDVKYNCSHKPEDFTLTAFGIPEPEELRPKSRWRWYLLLGFIGVAMVIGGMRLLQRRR